MSADSLPSPAPVTPRPLASNGDHKDPASSMKTLFDSDEASITPPSVQQRWCVGDIVVPTFNIHGVPWAPPSVERVTRDDDEYDEPELAYFKFDKWVFKALKVDKWWNQSISDSEIYTALKSKVNDAFGKPSRMVYRLDKRGQPFANGLLTVPMPSPDGANTTVLTLKAHKQGLLIQLTDDSLKWFVNAVFNEQASVGGDASGGGDATVVEAIETAEPAFSHGLIRANLFSAEEITDFGESVRYWQSKQLLRAVFAADGYKPIARTFPIRLKRKLSKTVDYDTCKALSLIHI